MNCDSDVDLEIEFNEEDEYEPQTKYKKHDINFIQAAIADIESGTSVRAASAKYNIAVNTLYWHKNNCNKERTLKKRGVDCVLTAEEENEIAKWLIQCAAFGDPRTKEDLIATAAEIRQLRIKSSTPIKAHALQKKRL